MIVPERPAEPLPALDGANGLPARTARLDQLVAEPLVVPLSVVMLDVLGDDLLTI
jgi:hypothetical protein